jgi:hypothetical protein
MCKNKRLWSILALGALGLGMLLAWFSSNFFYYLFWAFLRGYYIEQASVIAYTLANLIPFVSAIIIVGLIYLALRYELTRNPAGSTQSTQPVPIETQLSVLPGSQYMTAYETLHHLTDESEWGMRVRREIANEPLTLFTYAVNEFQRASQEGHIRTLGRPADGSGDHLAIANTYWFSATLDLESILNRQISRTRPTTPDRPGIRIFVDLRVTRAGVYKTWRQAAD